MANQQGPGLLAANQLILVCRDCESALSTAAAVAESRTIRDLYRRRAADWTRFRTALQDAVLELGGRPRKMPGVTGTLRRAWIKIQSGVGDPEAIAAECRRREADALRRCERVAEGDVPEEVRDIVARFCNRGRKPVYNQKWSSGP